MSSGTSHRLLATAAGPVRAGEGVSLQRAAAGIPPRAAGI